MTRHAIDSHAANGIGQMCADCGAIIYEGDGFWTACNADYKRYHHQSCVQAAYHRGVRRGYRDAVRQIRDATRALKGPK